MARPALDLKGLTREEKLQLLEDLWESLRPDDVALTEAQREELQRRLDQMDRDGASGIPWERVLREIQGRSE